MIIQSTGIVITNLDNSSFPSERNKSMIDITLDCIGVSVVAFNCIRKLPNTKIFTVSLRDIEKALRLKTRTDPGTKLLSEYHDFLDIFDHDIAEKLSPHRSGVDHSIELERTPDEIEAQPSWKPLYVMSKEELLVLRKTLLEYLDKNFIGISQSSATASVLFVKKPEERLRFCIDYGALNRIICKDGYLLSLIQETLNSISKMKYFIKLDIIAVFHKIRIAVDDEWKTAFRIRYDLYEWLMMSFRLANAPSTFQKYINWTLQNYLDEFCSVYIDDILIYINDSLEEHQKHIKKILERLRKAELQIDIDKYEFSIKTTKYLGFIINIGKGIHIDPEKIKAIKKWTMSISVKKIQLFLGFVNFYRRFIANFS